MTSRHDDPRNEFPSTPFLGRKIYTLFFISLAGRVLQDLSFCRGDSAAAVGRSFTSHGMTCIASVYSFLEGRGGKLDDFFWFGASVPQLFFSSAIYLGR